MCFEHLWTLATVWFGTLASLIGSYIRSSQPQGTRKDSSATLADQNIDFRSVHSWQSLNKETLGAVILDQAAEFHPTAFLAEYDKASLERMSQNVKCFGRFAAVPFCRGSQSGAEVTQGKFPQAIAFEEDGRWWRNAFSPCPTLWNFGKADCWQKMLPLVTLVFRFRRRLGSSSSLSLSFSLRCWGQISASCFQTVCHSRGKEKTSFSKPTVHSQHNVVTVVTAQSSACTVLVAFVTSVLLGLAMICSSRSQSQALQKQPLVARRMQLPRQLQCQLQFFDSLMNRWWSLMCYDVSDVLQSRYYNELFGW